MFECLTADYDARSRRKSADAALFVSAVIIQQWRNRYNTRMPHSAPGYHPLTPVTVSPKPAIFEDGHAMQQTGTLAQGLDQDIGQVRPQAGASYSGGAVGMAVHAEYVVVLSPPQWL